MISSSQFKQLKDQTNRTNFQSQQLNKTKSTSGYQLTISDSKKNIQDLRKFNNNSSLSTQPTNKKENIYDNSIFNVPSTIMINNQSRTTVNPSYRKQNNKIKVLGNNVTRPQVVYSNMKRNASYTQPWVDTKGTKLSSKKQDLKTMSNQYQQEVLPNLTTSKSTLGRKLNVVNQTEKKNMTNQVDVFKGLDQQYYTTGSTNFDLINYLQKQQLSSNNRQPEQVQKNRAVPTFSYNELKLKAARFKEPPFTVQYTLKVPRALETKVNR